MPHPGVFVLDECGIVTNKRFYQSYRERETGAGLVEQALGIAAPTHGAQAVADGEVVTVAARLDSASYAFGQRLWLTVQCDIKPEYHLYGLPIPDGFVPLSIDLEPVDGLVVGEPIWPPRRAFEVAGLDEQFHVYEGEIRFALPLTFGMRTNAGTMELRGRVRFQACTADACLPPASLDFALTVEPIDAGEEAAHGFAPR